VGGDLATETSLPGTLEKNEVSPRCSGGLSAAGAGVTVDAILYIPSPRVDIPGPTMTGLG
jgi:hypothetical protein